MKQVLAKLEDVSLIPFTPVSGLDGPNTWTYMFGSRKVQLSLSKDDEVVVRVGGGFSSLEVSQQAAMRFLLSFAFCHRRVERLDTVN